MLEQKNLTDMYKVFHPQTAEDTLFSSTRGTFSRVDYMLSYKTISSKFKKTETILRFFSSYNNIILEIKRRKNGKGIQRLNNLSPKKKEASGLIKKLKGKTNILRQMKIKTQLPKIYRKQQKLF